MRDHAGKNIAGARGRSHQAVRGRRRARASNGVLLRRDIHSLFDAGYVTITPKLKFEVSRRIKEEFENGRQYYELQGRGIAAPDDLGSLPDRAALAWHNENRYLE
jgi:putative restriction endonuclease